MRLMLAAGLGLALGTAPWWCGPIGRLSSPLALLIVLPPLAGALEAFGWRDALAAVFQAIGSSTRRIGAAYTVWIVTSAVLTLDVAAVAAASVGLSVAGEGTEEERWQLGGAVLGANVGSLLFPFSNLTNLLLVAAAGMAFATYVSLAVLPQIAAAVAVGVLLVVRADRAMGRRIHDPPAPDRRSRALDANPAHRTRGAAIAAGVAVTGASAAVVAGVIGADMAVPFAVSSGMLVFAAVTTNRIAARAAVKSIPLAGVAVIVVAALAGPLISDLAGVLPQPGSDIGGAGLAFATGAVLALAVNNLPAAALGAIWLAAAPSEAIVAFLIGTNIAVVATPHGSVATMLAHGVGRRHGVIIEASTYLRSAWRYGAVGAGAALVALMLVAR